LRFGAALLTTGHFYLLSCNIEVLDHDASANPAH